MNRRVYDVISYLRIGPGRREESRWRQVHGICRSLTPSIRDIYISAQRNINGTMTKERDIG